MSTYNQISIDGFADDGDGRAWTADGKWGLARVESGELRLLNEDGGPSNHTLPDDHAAYILAVCRRDGEDEWQWRWDYYASART